MAVEVDCIEFVVGTRGIVHEHDVVVFEILTHIFLIELLRCVLAGIDSLSVGRAERPGEFFDGCAEAYLQDVVHFAQHRGFALLHFGITLTFVYHGAEF